MNSPLRPIALLIIAIGALVVSGCADPAPSAGGTSDTGKSMVTTSWDLDPVDSVVALVPDEFKNRPIKNGIYNDFPPQEFLEGKTLVGIQPDIALALSEVMGVKFENVSVAGFDSLIPGTLSGRYDLSSADFGVTADRLKEVDFVTEFRIGTGFAVKKGSGITIDKATDLCGHSVGVQSGSYYIDQIKGADQECAAAGLGRIELKTYPNDGARTLAVTNGRIEVTATNEDVLAYTIASQNVPIELRKLVYEPLEQGIVMPDGSALGPAVQAAMKEIIANGAYEKILKKWNVANLAYASPDEALYLTDPSQLP
jgi:polar amino acid transport system substrate-binding protein